MTNKSLAILLALSSGCGLLNVNGKPLGGGTSSSAPSSSGSTSEPEPEATKTESHRGESHAEYEARRQREYEEQERKNAAEKAGQPRMCTEYGITNSRDIKLEDFADLDEPNHDWDHDAILFAQVMCSTRGAHLELRPKVMELRTRWMKQHGLDERDFLVVVQGSNGGGGQDYKDLPGPISQIPGASVETLDRWGANASMLAHISYVDDCLKSRNRKGLLETILCASEPVDAAKGLAEIDATPNVNPRTRYRLRQWVRATAAAHAAVKEELTKNANEDPGVSKLVAIADAQKKDWATPSATRTKLLQLVETMETATEAKKRSAFAGCEVTTRAAWADVVKAAELPAVAEKDVLTTMMNAVFTTPESYLAYRALSLCADGMDASFTKRLDIVGSAQVRRGPRSSMIAAWIAASAEIKFDSKELKMSELLRDVGARGGSFPMRVNVGTIGKVEMTTGGVHISFKSDTFEYEDCINWRSTGRITRIETNGAISYQQICTQTGRVKFDRKPEDVTLSSFVGGGLKPGMLLMVAVEESFPIVATASSKSTKAAWLFGVALK